MLLARVRLSPSDICESGSITDDLAAKAVRGGVSTAGAQLAYFLIQTGGTAVLARLLTPRDYGVMGMVNVVIAFAAVFKTFGLAMPTIQKANISRSQVSTLFWINLAVGLLLAICVGALSPLVGWFFREPAVVPITAILSITLLLNAAAVQHSALLRRHLRLSGLALASILGQVTSVGLSIGLAFAGLNYWALAYGTLAGAMVVLLLTFFLCPWIPSRPKRTSGVRGMLVFGADVVGFDFVNYFSRNLDNILIGRYWGSVSLAYYTKAYGLFMLPISQIRGPVFQSGPTGP